MSVNHRTISSVRVVGVVFVTDDEPVPPAGIPDDIADNLRGLDDHTLRETISFIREVLSTHHHDHLEAEIESIPEDELVSVTEHDGYVEVVRRHRCPEGCSDCPHGPYLYHVKSIPQPDGGDSLEWDLIGPVNE